MEIVTEPDIRSSFEAGFGIISEVVSTFSKKPVFGYKGMVGAMTLIAVIGALRNTDFCDCKKEDGISSFI